ncbi:flagellar hook-associated protein FlgK [Spirilliplanes yamanashiensis]|uniref:Flagellar hook-associated protein 1 n=1 Tax=Spirilliplanes yamanashiensis TaxID=42233 RepID=A0A8J3Y2Z4_9ACTN|nr:flagellar hook-associated protein FlgK [Spirilliplanes yamanashiensis]MDP9814367.1 flagellar hook-associated protein 1 FlgK [Spirilliplanes yamanashiensis]GIJ00650.1 flagellar hook-associated protein 1 [Spirilliplanes yamanashiensis]
MSSTFSGISGALSSLQAQRRGLDVTGQNIANANTEGYSRQRVNMESQGAGIVPARWSVGTQVGDGVRVAEVERVRNEFLENKGRAEHSTNAYLANQASVYGYIESSFGEPSDTGIQRQMSDFWAAFSTVSTNPDSKEGVAARTVVMTRAETLITGMKDAKGSLTTQWDSTRTQLDAYVNDVNTTASTIANLNDTIRRANASGLPVNELADQRDQLTMHLSKLTGATAVARDDGTADVFLNGSTLVSGVSARQIEVQGAGRLTEAGSDPVRIAFADSSNPVTLGGTMGSVTESLSKTIPGYADALDGIARSLADTVNAVHTTGYGSDGVTGRPFFAGTTADTLRVAITSPTQVAASAEPGGSLDNSIAEKLAKLGTANNGPDAQYRSLIGRLGVESQSAARRSDIQGVITERSDAARESESGVSLDEEMTNLLSYQRSYEAASRVISTIDEVLDVLVNRMAA